MPIIAKDNAGPFIPAPQGQHSAVCADVIDLGLVTGQYGTQHKISIVWLIDEQMDNGELFQVRSWYNLSLNESSNLSGDLESWRGAKFTEDERKGFDVEKLIGVPCLVNVLHNTKGDKTYANVVSVTPLPKGMEPLQVPIEFVRKKDQPDWVEPNMTPPPATQPEGADLSHIPDESLNGVPEEPPF